MATHFILMLNRLPAFSHESHRPTVKYFKWIMFTTVCNLILLFGGNLFLP